MSVITSSLSMMDISDPEIQVSPLSITKNGTYTAPLGSAYNPVNVDVQEEPWAPLQDGYSNFWFELTNDTLSPWLNFSAKNANATIDWGDGSGEQSLDTLTPTHTYSKSGRYIVKVKGVTGIGRQHSTPYTDVTVNYNTVLKNVELNSEVTTLSANSFWNCVKLEQIVGGNISSLGSGSFSYDASMKKINLTGNFTEWTDSCAYNFCLTEITFPQTVQSIIANSFASCLSLQEITIPASVTSIGNNAFSSSYSLVEIHCLSTTPPTIGTYVFNGLPTDFIIYVPVGYGDTYKSATGWSTYADHIVEEGQTPNRAMLSSAGPREDDEKPDDNER